MQETMRAYRAMRAAHPTYTPRLAWLMVCLGVRP